METETEQQRIDHIREKALKFANAYAISCSGVVLAEVVLTRAKIYLEFLKNGN